MLITIIVVILVAVSSDHSPMMAAIAATLPTGIPLSMYVVHSNAVAAGVPVEKAFHVMFAKTVVLIAGIYIAGNGRVPNPNSAGSSHGSSCFLILIISIEYFIHQHMF